MPYGVDKKQGGDSKENTSWMERCVSKVQASGKDKSSAIAICKAQLKKNKEASLDLEQEITIDNEVVSNYLTFRTQWITKSMNMGNSFEKAKALFEAYMAINNFNF